MVAIQFKSIQCAALKVHEEYNPHQLLGLHLQKNTSSISIWRPGAREVHLEVLGKIVKAIKVSDEGLFEYVVKQRISPYEYRIYHQNGVLAHDPYAFLPTFGEVDQFLFNKGVHYQLFDRMGAQKITHQGVDGVAFTVWAPSAKGVSLVADFNHWNGLLYPMRSMGNSGVWELFVPGITEGEKYKFEIKTQQNAILVKTDPYAYSYELRPKTAAIVANHRSFSWSDSQWLYQRSASKYQSVPLSIYEVHLGSWKRENGEFLNYRKIAEELAEYCLKMNFTHIELLPIQEHPLDESWGYQVTGMYAPTSRYGTVEDFQWFVNHLHSHGIGVILDWVPGHFPKDDFSLARFDGTALYEHEDARQGFHPHWGTYIFNFGRYEVVNFLVANALFWIEKMHVDGLRVDAVASMLYLDYGREHGEWIPNRYGGKENLEAIEFFKHLNSVIHEKYPGVLMIAEESTSFTGVTHSLEQGGLGFDFKWNMGWMNDTLRYFQKDPLFRSYHHQELTFGLLYAFSERFVSVLSHDEVVHGKKSLLEKMPGDLWQKFANLRLLLSYMFCQPGKKLLFMGAEIAQWSEWNCKWELDWKLLEFPLHAGMQLMVADLNKMYVSNNAFWSRECDYSGFEWVDFNDTRNSVISYLRKSDEKMCLCVHNFTPTFFPHYRIHTSLKGVHSSIQIFNSDKMCYGGSGKGGGTCRRIFKKNTRSFLDGCGVASIGYHSFRVSERLKKEPEPKKNKRHA